MNGRADNKIPRIDKHDSAKKYCLSITSSSAVWKVRGHGNKGFGLLPGLIACASENPSLLRVSDGGFNVDLLKLLWHLPGGSTMWTGICRPTESS